jgi:hypothetical protein
MEHFKAACVQAAPVYMDLQGTVAKAATDPVGHYARPDVLSLILNRSTRNVVQVVDDEPSKQTDERDGASIAVPATVRSGNSTDSSDGGQQDV